MDTEIIPAINSGNFADVKEKIEKVKDHARWIHIDVANGTFTKNTLWHNPEELKAYLSQKPNLLTEVHLMIENPEEAIDAWIETGAKLIIIHVETLKNFELIKQKCDRAKVFLMLSVAPDTDVHALDPYFDKKVVCYQVLSVHPGLPGQLLIESSYDKIKYIRANCPHCDLEVDGGVNSETIQKCRDAGANLFTAASAIFDQSDPKGAIDSLKKVLE